MTLNPGEIAECMLMKRSAILVIRLWRSSKQEEVVSRHIHWKPAQVLSSVEAAPEPFSLGPCMDNMLKRSVAWSTFGGETVEPASEACFVASTWGTAAAVSIFSTCWGFGTGVACLFVTRYSWRTYMLNLFANFDRKDDKRKGLFLRKKWSNAEPILASIA